MNLPFLYLRIITSAKVLLLCGLLMSSIGVRAQYFSSPFYTLISKTDSAFLFTRLLYDQLDRYELFYYDDFYSSFYDRNQTRKVEWFYRHRNSAGISFMDEHFDKGMIKESYAILESGATDTAYHRKVNYSNNNLKVSVVEKGFVKQTKEQKDNYFRENITIYTFNSSHQLMGYERKFENETISGRYVYNSMNLIDTVLTRQRGMTTLQYTYRQNSFIEKDIVWLLEDLSKKQKRAASKFKVYKNSAAITTNNDSFLRVVILNHKFQTAFIKYIVHRGFCCYYIMYRLDFDFHHVNDIQQIVNNWEKYKTNYPESKRNTIEKFKFYDTDGSYFTMNEQSVIVRDKYRQKALHFEKSNKYLKIMKYYKKLTDTEFITEQSTAKFYK